MPQVAHRPGRDPTRYLSAPHLQVMSTGGETQIKQQCCLVKVTGGETQIKQQCCIVTVTGGPNTTHTHTLATAPNQRVVTVANPNQIICVPFCSCSCNYLPMFFLIFVSTMIYFAAGPLALSRFHRSLPYVRRRRRRRRWSIIGEVVRCVCRCDAYESCELHPQH